MDKAALKLKLKNILLYLLRNILSYIRNSLAQYKFQYILILILPFWIMYSIYYTYYDETTKDAVIVETEQIRNYIGGDPVVDYKGKKKIISFYSETLSPDPILKGWCHYCFEKEGPYWMSFSLGEKKSDINPITKREPEFDSTSLIFYIDLKKDYDDRKYCQIEDEEP